jgi:cobalamin biosynthesis protein CobT
MARIRYFVKHETSHVVYSDFAYLNKVKPQGLLALINNLLEDHRIDYLNDSEYKGDVNISNAFWYLYANDISDRAKAKDKELQEQQLLTLPLFVWDASLRDWIHSANDTMHQMYKHLDADGKARLDKLDKYSAEMLSIREVGNAANVMDLAERILKDLYDQDPEEYKGKDDDSGTGEAGSGKGADGEEGKAVSDDVDRIITCSKLMKDIGHEHKPSRTGIHLIPGTMGKGAYAIPKPSDYVICGFDKKLPKVVADMICGGYFRSTEVDTYITNNARPMANKLRIKLQTRSRDRYEYGKKKGKLHNGSLHRLVSGNDKIAEKVFRQRVVSDTTDTAVCLLVDCSGSMSGKKFDMACAGAGTLAEALKPLNIAYSIYGFTNTVADEDPIVWLFSEFNEKATQTELVKRFSTASGGLWQNSDGDGIAYATARLAQRKEHRKVLLVLSDGSPCGREHAGDIESYTLKTIQHAENMGVDVYGIGICDSNVTRFYKKNVVVNDLNQLSPTILSIIDRSI